MSRFSTFALPLLLAATPACVRSGFSEWADAARGAGDGAADAARPVVDAAADSAQDAQDGPGTPLQLSALQVANVWLGGFDVSVALGGDVEGNGSATLYTCNDTDAPGCDPEQGAALSMLRDGVSFTSSFVAASPDDPGDTLRLRVRGADPDGVDDAGLDAVVTLRSTVAVASIYAANQDWNAYVKNDDASADPYHQDDVACDPVADRGSGGPDRCLHGGELREVVVAGLTSCAGYTIADALGVWKWSCSGLGDGGPLVFRSAGFQPDRGLRHLIDAGGFLPNRVQVTRDASGLVAAVSEPEVWGWGNPVQPLPANPTGPVVALASPSIIHFLASSAANNGYNIAADRVAVVTLPGAELRWGDGAADNCNASSGQQSAPNARALVCAGGRSFLWIETVTRARPADAVDSHLVLSSLLFSRLHLSEADTSDGDIVRLEATDNTRVTALTTRRAGNRGLWLRTCSHNAIDGLRVYDPAGRGLQVNGGVNAWNLIQDVYVEGAGDADPGHGVELDGPEVAFNKLNDVRVVDAFSYGIALTGMTHDNWLLNFSSHRNVASASAGGVAVQGPRNKLAYGVVSNNDSWGVRVQYWLGDNSFDTTVVGVLAVADEERGIYFQSQAERATGLHLTAVLSGDIGVSLLGADLVLVANALVAGNYGAGLTVSGSLGADGPIVDNSFFDIMSLDNYAWYTWPYQIQSWFEEPAAGSGNSFHGQLWLSGTSDLCNTASGDMSGDGLIDETCTDTGLEGSSSYHNEPSTAVLHVGLSSAAVFVGKVLNDDLANQSDSDGSAADSTIAGEDWLRFESRWRTWGRDGGDWPAVDQTSLCSAATCRIWDWRLRADDTVARERHGNFVDNAACPASAHGDVVLDDRQQLPHFAGINAVESAADGLGDDDGLCEPGELCHNRFLVRAMEVVMDGLGDDDGLCESAETCVYTPNVGAYQGEGDFRQRTCVFQDGGALGVHGVTLHAYPVNGG